MDKADRARLRSWAMDADHPTYPTPGERGTILQLLDALDAALAERDAALSRTRRLLPADVVGHVDMLSGEVMRYEREGDGE